MKSEPSPGSAPRSRAEFALAALVFAVPLAYLLTERTREIFWWRFSKEWLAGIAIYATIYAALLLSYRRAWPAPIVVLRKLGLATTASVLAVLVVWECGLRATDDAPFEPLENRGRHSFDPDVGHVYLPNYSQIIQSREFSTAWRSNAQGLRADRDFGPKPAGVARVLVVGDSFTVGDQVPVEQTYPEVMQQEFDARFGPGRVEVLNAGFPGFGTLHQRKWIEKFGCAFEPDLVVVGSTPNDLVENPHTILYEARNGALVNPKSTDGDARRYRDHRRWYSLPGFVERSLVMRKIASWRLGARLRGNPGSVHRRAFQIEQDQKSRELYALYEREILLARDAAKACGAKFAVLAIPFLEQLRPAGPNQDHALWGRRLTEIGARAGFPVVDLLPSFVAAGDPRALYWREDSHCRAAGYRLIGVGASSSLAELGAGVGLPGVEVRAR